MALVSIDAMQSHIRSTMESPVFNVRVDERSAITVSNTVLT